MKELISEIKQLKSVVLISSISIKKQVIFALDEIVDITYKTPQEVVDDILGYYDSNVVFKIRDILDVSLDYAEILSHNLIIDKVINDKTKMIVKLKDELKEYYHYNPLAKNIYNKNIIVIDDNDYLKMALQKINKKIEYYKFPFTNKEKIAFQFSDIIKEVEYLANEIARLLDEGNNDIIIYYNNDEYLPVIKEIFPFYNISYDIDENIPIASIFSVIEYQKNIKTYQDAIDGLEKLDELIKTEVISILNKMAFDSFDKDNFIYLLNKTKIKRKANGIVKIEKYNKANPLHKNIFIIGVNQKVIPAIYRDNDFLKDVEKTKLNLLTSTQKNIMEKERFIDLNHQSKIHLSYSLKGNQMNYEKSNLLEGYEIKIIDVCSFYSSKRALLNLAHLTDDYVKFSTIGSYFSNLRETFKDYQYNSYDNSFKGISKDQLNDLLKGKLILSYSSLENYYSCPFKYYLSSILRLGTPSNVYIELGNLFHEILASSIEEIDVRKKVEEYIKKKEIKLEKFYIDKYIMMLTRIIDVIKKQNNNSDFYIKAVEESITKEIDSKTILNGKIDKILECIIDDIKYAVVVDYKTGDPSTNLNMVEYGLNMQLLIYFILLDDYEFAGAYWQKILPTKPFDNNEKEYIKTVEKYYDLIGISTTNQKVLKHMVKDFDDNYIAKLKNGKEGITGGISNEIFQQLKSYAYNKILSASQEINNGTFSISPYRCGNRSGCDFCNYYDLCFVRRKDYHEIDFNKNFEFLGGDINDSQKTD